MGSVTFNDSYYVSGMGQSYQSVRIDFSESYDASTNRSTVSITDVYIKSNLSLGSCPVFGNVTINGATILSFNGGPSSSVNLSADTYARIPNSSGGAVVIEHSIPGGEASATFGLSGGVSFQGSTVFGAMYFLYYDEYVFGVETPVSEIVPLTTHTSKLTVKPNGGSWGDSASDQTFYQAPTSTKTIANPTRTGYTFTGWTKTGGGSLSGTTYTFGATNGTLKAGWQINSYTLTLTHNNLIAAVSGGGGIEYGTSPTLSAELASVTGYTVSFRGWYNDRSVRLSADNPYTGYVMPAQDVTIRALGESQANTFEVKFNKNGGSGTQMANQSFTYDQAQQLTKNTYTRTGYTFRGWATSAGGAVAYSDEQSVSNLTATDGAVVNLYAVWQVNTYALTITKTRSTVTVTRTSSPLGGGSVGPIASGSTLYYNDVIAVSFSPNTGYSVSTSTLNGSHIDSGATHTVKATVGIAVTSVANTYTVKFNPNPGSGASSGGAMADQVFTYNSAKTLTPNAFTRFYMATFDANGGVSDTGSDRADSTFLGWAPTPGGSVQYSDGQLVSNLTASQNGVFNLYAKWESGTLVLPSAERTGYDFLGWYTASTGGEKIGDAGATITPAESRIYYAQWSPKKLRLSIVKSESGITVSVRRTASPIGGAPITQLVSGAELFYGDALKISYSIAQGYTKDTTTVNGVDIPPVYQLSSVVTDVSVLATVELSAILYIGGEAYQAFIWSESERGQYEAFIGDGSNWEAY